MFVSRSFQRGFGRVDLQNLGHRLSGWGRRVLLVEHYKLHLGRLGQRLLAPEEVPCPAVRRLLRA